MQAGLPADAITVDATPAVGPPRCDAPFDAVPRLFEPDGGGPDNRSDAGHKEGATMTKLMAIPGVILAFALVGCAKQGTHYFHPDLVAGVVGVDAVLDPEVLARLAVGGQHGVPEVDELQSRLSGDVFFDETVGCLALGGFVPTARARSDAGSKAGHRDRHGDP